VATVKQYMATTETFWDRMGNRNTIFLWELWGNRERQTAVQQTPGSVCAEECTIGGVEGGRKERNRKNRLPFHEMDIT